MPTEILTLCNQALNRVGEESISASDFNSGKLWHHTLLRETVQEILFKMNRAKKDGLQKYQVDFSTVAGQATYDLGYNADLMAEAKLWFIGNLANNESDYELIYLTEKEARDKYIDFSDLTEQEKPSEWWFQTTSTAGQVRLYLNPIPDGIYAIRTLRYPSFSRVVATDITTCSIVGDMTIQKDLEAKLANELQKGNTESLIKQASETWHCYLAEDIRTDEINTLVTPYQLYTDDY